MSYSQPVAYAAAAPQLGIPAILDSDPLLQFKGARSVIKALPAATGSSIGPSSQVQFLIPQSMNGFIKPGSMYLKCKVTVEVPYDDIDPLPTTSSWAFAGNTKQPYSQQSAVSGTTPASSVLDRVTVTFPGGVQMSYPNYDKYHWGILLAHALSREYVEVDLRMFEHCTIGHPCSVAASSAPATRQVYVIIPLDIPVFNAPSAVPLCLLSGGITIDLITNSLIQALSCNNSTTGANVYTGAEPENYSLSELSLVYEELQVSPEFKNALREKVSVQPYSIGIADRTWLGLCDGSLSTRVNIGVGLSSMKALVGLNVGPVTSVRSRKYSDNNALIRWNMYVNGQQVNSMQLDTDVQNYAELTRSLQSLFDVTRTSAIETITTSETDARRTTYQFGQFAFGLSTAVYSDANFALSGIPVDQLSVEFERGAQSSAKWAIAYEEPDSGYVTYMWALHDSVLTVLPDGTVSVRK